MLLELIRKILRRSESQSWRNDTFDAAIIRSLSKRLLNLRGIGSKVDEESTVADRSTLLKVLFEESRGFHVHSHGSKNDREIILVPIMDAFGSARSLHKSRLTTNLGGDLITVSRSLNGTLHGGPRYGEDLN